MMGKTVKSTRRNTIHYVAQCDECNFVACIFTDETPEADSVRKAARRHVVETGHSVCIEGGTSTTYSATSTAKPETP